MISLKVTSSEGKDAVLFRIKRCVCCELSHFLRKKDKQK